MTTTTTHGTEFVRSDEAPRSPMRSAGAAPAVVLVDGAMCQRAMGPARRLAKELAGSFTVFAYDRRGRGESRTGASPYAMAREVEDLLAVIEAAGGTAHVRWSLGTAVGILGTPGVHSTSSAALGG